MAIPPFIRDGVVVSPTVCPVCRRTVSADGDSAHRVETAITLDGRAVVYVVKCRVGLRCVELTDV